MLYLAGSSMSRATVCRLDMAAPLTFESEADQEKHTALDFSSMRRAAAATQELCACVCSPTVFSHNDLLSGNIMAIGEPWPSDPESAPAKSRWMVQFIDFEYSGCSFRGFDWGAHRPASRTLCLAVARPWGGGQSIT